MFMLTHFIECSEPYWSLVRNRQKPVEGRKGTEKWRKIVTGDTLVFTNEGRSFNTVVTGINEYKGEDPLREYLLGEGLHRALPNVATLEEGIAVYLQWSTQEEIKKHKFLGIQVSPI